MLLCLPLHPFTRIRAFMTKSLLATLTHVHDSLYELRNDTLNITVKHHCPTPRFCREVVKRFPEYSDHSLKVVDKDGATRFTINHIKDWSGKTITETDTAGLRILNYKLPNIKKNDEQKRKAR